MYTSYPNMVRNYNTPNTSTYYSDDDRFFLAPFLVGGLAGTALGYGIANNNSNQGYYPVYPMYPVYQSYPVFPAYSNSYNYYY